MTTSYLFNWTQLIVFCVQDSEKYQVNKISTNNLLIWMLSISLKTTDLWFLWDSPTEFSLSIIKTSWISWIKSNKLINIELILSIQITKLNFIWIEQIWIIIHPTYRLGVDYRKYRIGYFIVGRRKWLQWRIKVCRVANERRRNTTCVSVHFCFLI